MTGEPLLLRGVRPYGGDQVDILIADGEIVEIGESITRWVPNSSTKPSNTLKGVPASATSSPMIKTRLSRRISSAMASLIASP